MYPPSLLYLSWLSAKSNLLWKREKKWRNVNSQKLRSHTVTVNSLEGWILSRTYSSWKYHSLRPPQTTSCQTWPQHRFDSPETIIPWTTIVRQKHDSCKNKCSCHRITSQAQLWAGRKCFLRKTALLCQMLDQWPLVEMCICVQFPESQQAWLMNVTEITSTDWNPYMQLSINHYITAWKKLGFFHFISNVLKRIKNSPKTGQLIQSPTAKDSHSLIREWKKCLEWSW